MVEVVWVWKVEEWVGGGREEVGWVHEWVDSGGSGREWLSGWRRVGWVVEGVGAGWVVEGRVLGGGRVGGRGGGCWLVYRARPYSEHKARVGSSSGY